MTVQHEGDRMLGEVPQDWPQRLEPLHGKNHVEGAKREDITIQDELLIGDGQWHVTTTARALDVVTIGDNNLKAGATTKTDIGARDSL
jgi:hypothetical protein